MDPFKILEARLINIQLLVLSLKYKTEHDHNKGQLVDLEYALNSTRISEKELFKSVTKGEIPIYFFEADIKAFAAIKHKKEILNG
ncbi:MAG: hypothetical protein IPP81_14610 [Chitinophagaceae bacterium]|nr:hypothetical protein [Chitinophagaceae bacterium]